MDRWPYAKTLPYWKVSAKLEQVADHIQDAAKLMTELALSGNSEAWSRIAQIDGQRFLEPTMVDAFRALAEAIHTEGEAADAADEEPDDARRANPFEPDFRRIA